MIGGEWKRAGNTSVNIKSADFLLFVFNPDEASSIARHGGDVILTYRAVASQEGHAGYVAVVDHLTGFRGPQLRVRQSRIGGSQ